MSAASTADAVETAVVTAPATDLAAPRRRRQRRRDAPITLRVTAHVLLIGGVVVALAPFVWMVATSFKQPQDVFTPTPDLLPTDARTGEWAGTFANYLQVLDLE